MKMANDDHRKAIDPKETQIEGLTKEQRSALKDIGTQFSLTGWAIYDLITIVEIQASINKSNIQLKPETWEELTELQKSISHLLEQISAFGRRKDVSGFLHCYELQKQFNAISAYPEMQGFTHLAKNLFSPAHQALSNLSDALKETLEEKPGWNAKDKPRTKHGGRRKSTHYLGMAIRLAILWKDNDLTVSSRHRSSFVKFVGAILGRVLQDDDAGAERLAEKAITFIETRRRN